MVYNESTPDATDKKLNEDILFQKYDITACYDISLNDNQGGWRYTILNENKEDNIIFINTTVSLCLDDVNLEIIYNLNELSSISPNDICTALIDLEKQRYYPARSEKTNYEKFYNADVALEHELVHQKMFDQAVIKESKRKISIPFYQFTKTGTVNDLLNENPLCEDIYSSRDDVISQGRRHYSQVLRQFEENLELKYGIYHEKKAWINEKWYKEHELLTNWSNSVQKKITDYQRVLITMAEQNSVDISNCNFVNEDLRQEFSKYRNEL